MENFILPSGWGVVDGKWVYVPLWDPSPTSKLGKDLLSMIVIKANLPFIHSDKAIKAFRDILTQKAKAVATGFASTSFDPLDNGWCGTPPLIWPPRKGPFTITFDAYKADFKEIQTAQISLQVKANLLQLGKQLKDRSITDASKLI